MEGAAGFNPCSPYFLVNWHSVNHFYGPVSMRGLLRHSNFIVKSSSFELRIFDDPCRCNRT